MHYIVLYEQADLVVYEQAENGVEGAIEAFYKHLPLSDMLCDVSIFLGESRLAQVCRILVIVLIDVHNVVGRCTARSVA